MGLADLFRKKEEITIRTKWLTTELVSVLKERNLYLGPGGGMHAWFEYIERKAIGQTSMPFFASWMGTPPRYVTVAYNSKGIPIGWCGIGDNYIMYREASSFRLDPTDLTKEREQGIPTGVVATFVDPEYREKGLATRLLKETLRLRKSKSKIIALDTWGWNCSEHIKEAGYIPVSHSDYIPEEYNNVS